VSIKNKHVNTALDLLSILVVVFAFILFTQFK